VCVCVCARKCACVCVCGEMETEHGGGRENTGEGVVVISFLALCMGIRVWGQFREVLWV